MEKFNVSSFFNDRFDGINLNVVSRLCNTLIRGIGKQAILPKFILVIPDDDIIHAVKYCGFRFSEAIGKLIHYIMSEHNKIIEIQKDFLPKNSQCHGVLQFIWIKPPLHVNFPNNAARAKFNAALDSMAQHNNNVQVLELKKGWDHDDQNLFIYESGRFMMAGYGAYWLAVDKTGKFADTILLKKLMNLVKKCDKFHWKKNYNIEPRRKLPQPPPV